MFQNTNIRKLRYRIKYQYPTREVVTMVAIAVMILWFIWGSVQAMQKNYELRKVVDAKARQEKLIDLQTQMLEYDQNYLQSDEYKKLAVRDYLGYGDPGEKLLVLPKNSDKAIQQDKQASHNPLAPSSQAKPSNFSQWLNFLLGAHVDD